MHPNAHARHQQQGFSLLEALVTIVVVSIGLLGILGLQTASLVNTQVSASRSVATMLSDNIAARMQANPTANYIDDTNMDYPPQNNSAKQALVDETPKDCSTSCSATEIRQRDRLIWHQALQRRLPSGRGFVDCIAHTDCSHYRITIVWDEHQPTAEQTANDNGENDLCENDPPSREITDRCFVTELRS